MGHGSAHASAEPVGTERLVQFKFKVIVEDYRKYAVGSYHDSRLGYVHHGSAPQNV